MKKTTKQFNSIKINTPLMAIKIIEYDPYDSDIENLVEMFIRCLEGLTYPKEVIANTLISIGRDLIDGNEPDSLCNDDEEEYHEVCLRQNQDD